MVHLRIVTPPDRTDAVLGILDCTPSVINIVQLPAAAHRPDGDVVLADVAREDASVVIEDLKRLKIHEDGSIALELIDTAISRHAEMAERHAPGAPADAVVWEEVEERTSENVELSGVFLLFMVLAALIASVGIFLDSEILIVGAMVVGPEFGPIAGFCVALISHRRELAVRSGVALAVGFPLAIAAVYAATHVFKATGLTADDFSSANHQIADLIASPDIFSVIVAVCAGAAGMLSLSTAKSGALIGVLISVTTIPAAANIGVAAAYNDRPGWTGSLEQLAINLASILIAGTTVLAIQRLNYERRRRHHLRNDNPPLSRGSARAER
ncbi:MAG TPA: DUF389 domain-containing protein [Solirubrobacteraceae bacterium]|jgi:uncharacterized hydrophobic protein (TIGR00271 family)|nr:DUF389 domain-containing protein [Solirubrobacteraceae bacterium]